MLRGYPITLAEKKLVAENTTEMTFSVGDPSFKFKAGQYISVEIPSLADAAVPDRYHDFSIVSSPKIPLKISIVFRNSESVFKKALMGLPFGDSVRIDGPKGVLVLPESTTQHLIFVAGGVGISPLLSMLRYATENSLPQPITLIYCNSQKETAAYREELDELSEQNTLITYEEVWGIPQEKIFVSAKEKHPNALWYIVGAPAMVESVEKILMKLGVLAVNIRIEEFSGYRT